MVECTDPINRKDRHRLIHVGEGLQNVTDTLHPFFHSSWNRGSVAPLGIEVLQAVVRVNDPDAIVWRGDPTLPGEDQSVRILGTPLGLPDFVRSQLSALSETHDQLLEKVLTIQDLQCVWLLLYLLLRCSGKLHPQSDPPGVDRRIRSPPRRFTPEMPATFLRLLLPIHWDLASLPLCLRLSAPQCNIARKTRFLGKLGRLFGDDPPETPNRLRSHCGRFPCPAPSLPLGRGPRFWRTSGICWVPGTFLAGVGGWCSS